MDDRGNMYMGRELARMKHSSFLAAGSVAFAGEVAVYNGKVVFINPRSGHYLPGRAHMEQLVAEFRRQGMAVDDDFVEYDWGSRKLVR